MPKHLFFRVLPPNGHVYRYGLEVIYRERHLPTTLSIFFCTVKYTKVEGKGFVMDSHRTNCYDFDYNSGKLDYVSYHNGDFTKPGFRWADTRIAQLEYDQIKDEHRVQAQKTAQRVYDFLQEEKMKSNDQHWQEEHEPFLSPLEIILAKKD